MARALQVQFVVREVDSTRSPSRSSLESCSNRFDFDEITQLRKQL
jgi:hypothetical protein